MIKYYFTDSATDEKVELEKDAFYGSLLYNLDESVKHGEKTTYEALCDLKFMMSQNKKINSREVYANGFYYNVEVCNK
jgi:hypothetical protein